MLQSDLLGSTCDQESGSDLLDVCVVALFWAVGPVEEWDSGRARRAPRVKPWDWSREICIRD